jgi:hypothetical protein
VQARLAELDAVALDLAHHETPVPPAPAQTAPLERAAHLSRDVNGDHRHGAPRFGTSLVLAFRNPVSGIAIAVKMTATQSAERNPEMNASGES